MINVEKVSNLKDDLIKEIIDFMKERELVVVEFRTGINVSYDESPYDSDVKVLATIDKLFNNGKIEATEFESQDNVTVQISEINITEVATVLDELQISEWREASVSTKEHTVEVGSRSNEVPGFFYGNVDDLGLDNVIDPAGGYGLSSHI